MNITLDITKITSGLRVWNDLNRKVVNENKKVGHSRWLELSVTPQHPDFLELGTGEIFHSLDHARLFSGKAIFGDLILIEMDDLDSDEVRDQNRLLYQESFDNKVDGYFPSKLLFFYHLEVTEFGHLYSSVISGHPPKSVTVEFPSNLRDIFGLEYALISGDGLRWDTKKSERIPISKLEFRFIHSDKNNHSS